MRLLVVLYLLLCALPAWSQGCFKAIQNGEEVDAICAGIPVYFVDCGTKTDPKDIIFYYVGPEAFASGYDAGKLIEKGDDGKYQYTYTHPGTYIITQIINREGGGGTSPPFPRTIEVKVAPEPAFSTTICANAGVQVNITDTNYDLFDIDYGDGTIRRDVKAGIQSSYTYTGSSPSQTITITGKFSESACENTSQQTVQLLPRLTIPVIARLEVARQATDGELQLNLGGLQPGYTYVVERFSPALSTYVTVFTTGVISQNTLNNLRITGINTSEAANYRVRPIDPCGSSLTITSAPVSSISLNTQAGNELATLTWTATSTDVQRFDISRNGGSLQQVGRDTKTYTDRNLTCGQNYCYTVSSVSSDGASMSVSAPQCITGTSTTPPPAGYLYTSYNQDNQVELLFAVPQGHEAVQVQYQRSLDGSPYQELATTEAAQLTDKLQKPAPACYRATYTNPCKLTSSLSNVSCPVLLVVTTPDNAEAVSLGWTGYVGFPDGVGQYSVELLDENNQVQASYPATGNTFTDRNLSDEVQELRYRIKVTSGSGSAVSYSNTEVVRQPLQVHLPTAFTPNNDGLNDVLEIKGRFIREFRITVYNSMGHVVFQSNDRTDGWDGTYQGKPQPAGAYAYEINIVTTAGEKKRRTGTVTLLR
ncbi:T9SS type B sorting domain-containing protein [Pontibacter roseus]|uniref:T9SS type B sorting domain-containing protein n=1 Tax=Pontibacter roseus TaxID=336989 RepID=UPI00037F6511|nr:gliding motility-associated C-terminal domain-containing protein [Pontibacter roseus]